MIRRLGIVFFIALCCIACKEQQLTLDSHALLTFSADSIYFDTVFTDMGSSTRQIMVYNRNANAIRISRVWWQKGQCFFANLDGENKMDNLRDIEVYGGDSLYLFVRVQIDPYAANAHPLEIDTLFFEVNGTIQPIAVQAYGMDVHRIHSKALSTYYPDGLRLTADTPYLIYDTLWVQGHLTIDAGARLYMHQTASIIVNGSIAIRGTEQQPVRIMGDRTDLLFPQVPYRVASGQWPGIYVQDTVPDISLRDTISHAEILSGQVGLFFTSNKKDNRAHVLLSNVRIHNMSSYGLVLENTDADIANAEISNCASYGIYMAGGQHNIEHTTVANYFGYPYTTINIHTAHREEVAAVYVLAHAYDGTDTQASIRNCIIAGAVQPSLVIDSISDSYHGQVTGCYLQCDTLPAEWATNNVYAQQADSVFKNTFYRYKEYIYYDFHLLEQAPARHIGVPLEQLTLQDIVGTDLQQKKRDTEHPDAGCYEYE